MLLYISVVSIAVLLSLLDTKKEIGGLKAAFVLLTLFLGFRYMYGTDYSAYMELFKECNTDGIPFWDIPNILQSDIYGEPGWHILNKIFQPFGYFGMILALSVFENIVIYRLIKRSVPSKWYWLAIIVYMLNTRLFLIGACSMERQWLAVCILIIAIKYVEKQKIIPYFLLVLFAGSFHASAYILLPLYFLCYVKNMKLGARHVVIIIVFLIVWSFVAPLLMEPFVNDILLAEKTVFSDYGRFENMDFEKSEYTLLGVISEGIVSYLFPLLCLLLFKKLTPSEQIMTVFYLFALFIKPFSYILPMISRIDYYNIVFSIFLIPIVLSVMAKKNIIISFMLVAMLLILLLRQTVVFLTESSWAPDYEYKTILLQPWM